MSSAVSAAGGILWLSGEEVDARDLRGVEARHVRRQIRVFAHLDVEAHRTFVCSTSRGHTSLEPIACRTSLLSRMRPTMSKLT